MSSWNDNGLTLYKVGKLVCFVLYSAISHSSPLTHTTVPSEYIPKGVDYRTSIINNQNDNPCGQLIIRTANGAVDLYLGGGGTFNTTYCASGCYVVD